MISGKSFIGGEWVEGLGSDFTSFDPSTKTKIKDYRGVDVAQINKALESASKAFSIYKCVGFDERATFLDDIANEIEALGTELLEVCNKETGLGIGRLTGERARTCNQLRAFSELVRDGSWQEASIDTSIPDRSPNPKPDIRSVLRPIGPIAVFSASNFPLAFSTLGGDTASALAAGNSVVIKGHPSHPGTSELCARAIEKAILKNKLPSGLFNLLQGASPSTSNDLVMHPKLSAVGFTGSTHVGRILYNLGSSRPIPIPVYAEMGSSNPVFILPKSLEKEEASLSEDLAASITLGNGQFCTKPGLVFIIKSKKTDIFLEKLVACIGNMPSGVFLNSGIDSSFNQKINSYKQKNELTELTKPSKNNGSLFRICAKDFIKKPQFEEEVFGPAALIIACDDFKEMMEAANTLSGHLTGTIHTNGDSEADPLKVVLEDKVGRIIYNGYPTGVEVCPSMHHGGPYPSSTFSSSTSVGTAAIKRFCKVVCYQSAPQNQLPEALKNENPRGITRLLNGIHTINKLV